MNILETEGLCTDVELHDGTKKTLDLSSATLLVTGYGPVFCFWYIDIDDQ
jgi:hypothetical protein